MKLDLECRTLWAEISREQYAETWAAEEQRGWPVAVGGFLAHDGTAYRRQGERYYRAKEPMTVAEFRAEMKGRKETT